MEATEIRTWRTRLAAVKAELADIEGALLQMDDDVFRMHRAATALLDALPAIGLSAEPAYAAHVLRRVLAQVTLTEVDNG